MKTSLKSALLAALIFATPAAALAVKDTLSAHHGEVWRIKKIGAPTQGFIQIRNTAASGDVLIGWDCPIADTTTLVDAKGKALQSLAIPAGQRVTLAADGPHLVLQGTHVPIAMGSVVPCSLTFEQAGEVAVYLNSIPAPRGG